MPLIPLCSPGHDDRGGGRRQSFPLHHHKGRSRPQLNFLQLGAMPRLVLFSFRHRSSDGDWGPNHHRVETIILAAIMPSTIPVVGYIEDAALQLPGSELVPGLEAKRFCHGIAPFQRVSRLIPDLIIASQPLGTAHYFPKQGLSFLSASAYMSLSTSSCESGGTFLSRKVVFARLRHDMT